MRKIKGIVIAALLAVTLVGFQVEASCTATATSPGCNASCSVNPPPGGSSTCTSARNRADCTGYDAAGNLCCSTGCVCPGGIFGMYCYISIGSTCC